MIKHLKEDNFYDEVSKGTVLVDFYADWCGPCQMMGEILENIDANILKVNTDEFGEIAQKHGVMSIPTLVLYKDGSEVDKMIGLQSKEDIEDFISQKGK
ncbi:MAG: thioredoxin [Bacilli bacterium]|nr:thioredoxin [Bacilli bacterium]